MYNLSLLPENGGLHDDHVRSLHAGQVPLPVLRPASHGRGPGRLRPSAAAAHTPSSTAADTSPRPGENGGPHPAGAAPGRPQGDAPESLCPGRKEFIFLKE